MLPGKYSKVLIGSETLVTSLGSTFTLLPRLSNLGIDHSTIWDSMRLWGFEPGSYVQNREQKEKASFYSYAFGRGMGFGV